MIRSMTAFARYEDKNDLGVLTWEMRTVNHRYLEVSLRLPEDLRGLEQALREKIALSLSRGKLECNLRFKPSTKISKEIVIDEILATAISQAGDRVARLSKNSAPLNPIDILRWPGVMQEAEVDITPLQAVVMSSLDKALNDLVQTREKEGARLQEMIIRRCDSIDEVIRSVKKRRPEVMRAIREKLQTRVAELVQAPNQDRLEQELVMLAQKMDVEEEIDRLELHIKEVRDVLVREDSVGRRLDFLMQELNREANTLSSKSGDIETTQASVDLKVAIEQMREQIQNIE